MAERARVNTGPQPRYRITCGGQVLEIGNDLPVADKTARLWCELPDETERVPFDKELPLWFDEHGYSGLREAIAITCFDRGPSVIENVLAAAKRTPIVIVYL